MNLANLLRPEYWFSQPRVLSGAFWWAGIICFLGLAAVGIILLIIRARQEASYRRKLLARAGSLGITMGLLGMLWFWLRQARVFFLGWRFWLVIWLAVFVVWLASILKYVFQRLPQIKAEQAERERKEKYLPR